MTPSQGPRRCTGRPPEMHGEAPGDARRCTEMHGVPWEYDHATCCAGPLLESHDIPVHPMTSPCIPVHPRAPPWFRLQKGSAADRRVIAEYCIQVCDSTPGGGGGSRGAAPVLIKLLRKSRGPRHWAFRPTAPGLRY